MFTARPFVTTATVALIVAAPAFAQLKQTPLPDGTGSIGLAPGWTIHDAYRGSVACYNETGAGVVLKLPWVIMRPENSVSGLPGAAAQPMASTGDITTALREIIKKKVGGKLIKLRGNRVGGEGGPPAYQLFYEYTQNGKTITAIGYFAVLDYGGDQPFWQLYSSAIVAPKAQFAHLAPTMMKMWRSWHPNGEEPREGSISKMFDKVLNARKESYEEIQKQFRENL